MKHTHLALTLGASFASLLLIFISCRKINEATTLGGDLIPAVDNINTFDTTLEVQAFNDTFSLATDSTLNIESATHYLGLISNDPLFGKTDARLFLELKPYPFKFTFINRPDSLHIDSVVLILSYVGLYGDSTVSQTVNVYEIDQSSDFRYDTSYRVRETNIVKAGLLGSRTFSPTILNDSVQAYQDTTANQLRIRLNDSFGQRLLNYDTANINSHQDAYSSDSAFRSLFKGFALESLAGNAIMGFNLNGVNTKLAIYYKDDNGDKPVADWDTTVTYFSFSANPVSASANYIKRDYSGTPLESAVGGSLPDDLVYIQTTPGSFATIKIPGLASLSNRVVHKAELIMEQVYHSSDTLFPPVNLYVDAYDSGVSAFRTIPYDFALDISGNPNLSDLGTSPRNGKDGSGNSIKIWRYNLTRYVQHVVNDTEPIYDLRLFSPHYIRELYRPGGTANESTLQTVIVNDAAGKGRVRLGGGNHATQRMRLRIVYSKI